VERPAAPPKWLNINNLHFQHGKSCPRSRKRAIVQAEFGQQAPDGVFVTKIFIKKSVDNKIK
jgi:hypothetical protein